MWGTWNSARSPDGTQIGYLSAGRGPALLLVHGGMSSSQAWEFVWPHLTAQFHVAAMDRRGRGRSPDDQPHSLEAESEDVLAVAGALKDLAGGPVQVVGHSYGATCVFGAAARGGPFGRVVLYEPPGPRTVPADWLTRIAGYLDDGQPGRAMVSFLSERIGLSETEIEGLRQSEGQSDWAQIVTATMVREGRALQNVDLVGLAREVADPVLLLLGENSPDWAGEIAQLLRAHLRQAELVMLPGQGHQALITAPALVAERISTFLLT